MSAPDRPSSASTPERVLFLHLGPHKTGTTYLQRLFTSARDAFEAQDLLYPEPGDGREGHHRLAQELLDGPGDEARALAADIHDFAGDALLSSENFSRLDRERLGWFRSTFPDHRLAVIHFVRGRGGTLYSLWQEDIKHGADVGLPEYVARVLCRPYTDRVVHPALLLDVYEGTADDYRIVVYDNVLREDGDIFDVVVDTCLGRTVPGELARPGWVNRSLDPVRVEVIRLLNFIHARRGGPRNHFLRSRFLEKAGSVPEVADFVERARAALDGRARSLPLANLGKVFLHLDRKLLERAGERVVNAAGEALFTGEVPRSYEYFAGDEALELLGGWPELERLYTVVS